ncbi:MAG: translation elongation factor Ts [Patescibacteria group bacterium]|nr:translation elongation factor Ts [Patescibacteria group bacterium]
MLQLIKELRGKTGAGMGACKKALDETNNDIERAIEYLRKQGIAKAAKRGDKEASEGIIKLALSDGKKTAYMIKVSAETDFVVRNEKFQNLTDKILETLKSVDVSDKRALLDAKMDENTAGDALANLSGTIGEKMEIKDVAVIKAAGTLSAYSHLGGKIGVLISLDKEGEDDLAHDIAMQVAATDPKYLNPEEVPSEETDKEKEIYKEQLLKEGKPENIIDKILEGKINKYYEEVCLLNQEYIKDDKKKVKDILGEVKIEKFIRFSLN